MPDRLRAVEAERPANSDDALRRAREISALLADPALTNAVAQPCPGDAASTQIRTLARQRTLVLWAGMIALEAVDAPVFPAPYDRRCAAFDGATWQAAFVRAYVARLDAQGTDAPRPALRQSLDEDPLAGHVRDLVAARAQRLRIGALPAAGSDEAAWQQYNESARARAQAALAPGVRCGALPGVLP